MEDSPRTDAIERMPHMDLTPPPLTFCTLGTPFKCHVIQGKENVRKFVQGRRIAQGEATPIPADWLQQLENYGIRTDDDKWEDNDELKGIQTEEYWWSCAYCKGKFPEQVGGLVQHIRSKKHKDRRARQEAKAPPVWPGWGTPFPEE